MEQAKMNSTTATAALRFPHGLFKGIEDMANQLANKMSTVQVTSGPCKAIGECVTSPGYPNHYSNYQGCSFTMLNRAIEVVKFRTESYWDKLTVNGVAYSGSNNPEGVVPTRAITWSSDINTVYTGWKICTR